MTRLQRELIFDEARKSWIKMTPEERVRQTLLRHLIHRLKFPRRLIVIEKELKELPHLLSSQVPERRIDILCYTKDLFQGSISPFLLIECKKENSSATAIDQVIGYNYFVKAPFIAVVDEQEIKTGYFHSEKSSYVFNRGLPSYQELLEWSKS